MTSDLFGCCPCMYIWKGRVSDRDRHYTTANWHRGIGHMCTAVYIFALPTVSSVSLFIFNDCDRYDALLFLVTLKRCTHILFLEHSGARSSTQSGTNTPIDRSYTSNGVYIARAWRRMREERNGEGEGSGRDIEEKWSKEDRDGERDNFKSNLTDSGRQCRQRDKKERLCRNLY
jgi:hypothetical protein